MVNVIIGLLLVLAVLLVLVVLVQDSKGGLSGTFGGSGSQIMGAKRTTDLLEKLTWGFMGGIMVLALSASLTLEKPTTNGFSSPNVEEAQSKSVVSPQSLQQPQTPAGTPSTTPVEQTPTPAPVSTDSTKK